MDIEKLKVIPIDELVDIRDVKINMKLSREERVIDYIRQIKNPYCYKYDKYKVIVTYNNDENAPNLEYCLKKYFENI